MFCLRVDGSCGTWNSCQDTSTSCIIYNIWQKIFLIGILSISWYCESAFHSNLVLQLHGNLIDINAIYRDLLQGSLRQFTSFTLPTDNNWCWSQLGCYGQMDNEWMFPSMFYANRVRSGIEMVSDEAGIESKKVLNANMEGSSGYQAENHYWMVKDNYFEEPGSLWVECRGFDIL